MKIKTIKVYEDILNIDFTDLKVNEQFFVEHKLDDMDFIDSFLIKDKYFKNQLIFLNKIKDVNSINKSSVLILNNHIKCMLFSHYNRITTGLFQEDDLIINFTNKYVDMHFYFKSNGFQIEIFYKMKYDKNMKFFNTTKKIVLKNEKYQLVFNNRKEFEHIVDFLMDHCESNYKDEFIKYRKIINYDIDDFFFEDDDKCTYNFFKYIMLEKNIMSLRMFESLFNPIYTTKDNVNVFLSFKEEGKYLFIKDNKVYPSKFIDDYDKYLIIYLTKHKFNKENYITPKSGSIIRKLWHIKKIYSKRNYIILKVANKYIYYKYYNGYWMEIPNDIEESINLLEEYQVLKKLES